MVHKCADNKGYDFSGMENVVFVEKRDPETFQLLGLEAQVVASVVEEEQTQDLQVE